MVLPDEIYLNISNVGEISWFLQVVKSFVLHQLSDNLVSDLVSPLIDDWHVDVINKYCHLFPRGWTIGTAHSLVHITLHCSL